VFQTHQHMSLWKLLKNEISISNIQKSFNCLLSIDTFDF